MRRLMIVAAAALLCLAAFGWGAIAWINTEVDRRVAAEVRRRTILPPPWRAPSKPRQPESIEDYSARVEWAKQRLAVRGITDPSPHQIQMELIYGK